MGVSAKGNIRPTGRIGVRNDVPPPPVWTTAAGPLGTVQEGLAGTWAVNAVNPTGGPVTYSLASGSLPTGFTLNPATGAITGTAGQVNGDAVATFTVRATNLRGIHADQTFSITVGDFQPQPTGRVMWFDAADTTTYSLNASNQLLTWNSKTSNSQTLTGVGSRPYVAYTQNGMPTMTFSYDNYANFGGTAPTLRTIIAVMRYRVAPSGKANFFLFCDSAGIPFHGNGYGNPSDGRVIADTATSNANFYNGSVSTNGGASFALARSTPYWNNFRVVICRLAGGIARTSNIGRDRNAHCFAGDIAELMVWNSTLSTADEASAVSYLKTKWGL